MRVACPACHTTYELTPAQLGAAPRKLRCARCRHEWTVEPPPIAAPIPAPPPEPPARPAEPLFARLAAAPRPAETLRAQRPPVPRGSGFSQLAALGVSVLILCGLAACAYVWRAELMTLWPPSRRLFAWLGLG
jgi:predicted Zn finger-like uncharacterized protein